MFLPLGTDTPRLRFPFAVAVLAGVCLGVFLYQMGLSDADQLTLARAGGVVPWEIAHHHDLIGADQPRDIVPPPLTVITSLFLHGDLLHLLGNLWFLWIFGSALEGLLGASRFLLLFFVSACAAAALQVAVAPDATVPMIGASGAIAGLLGGYGRVVPRARVRCLVFLLFFVTWVSIPAWVLLALWMLAQLVSAGGAHPGVAWYAHVGGLVTGLALGRLLVRPARPDLVYSRAP